MLTPQLSPNNVWETAKLYEVATMAANSFMSEADRRLAETYDVHEAFQSGAGHLLPHAMVSMMVYGIAPWQCTPSCGDCSGCSRLPV